jgi:hypothetical protein
MTDRKEQTDTRTNRKEQGNTRTNRKQKIHRDKALKRTDMYKMKWESKLTEGENIEKYWKESKLNLDKEFWESAWPSW